MGGDSGILTHADLEPTFRRAVDRYAAGEPLTAAFLFSAVLAREPLHADALRLRGLALVRAGRAHAALPDLRAARRLAPADPLSTLHCGIGWLEAGRPARAAALFRRAAPMMPDSEAPWINLSTALLALGERKAARAAARRGVALAPGSAPAQNALGLAEMAAGDLEAGQIAFAEAIRLARSDPEAWINLVLLLVRRGKIDMAFTAIERGLAACPGTSALEAAGAGLSVLVGNQDEAMERLRAILARDPACVAARLNLANALLMDDMPKEALALLDGTPPAGRDGAHWRAHRSLALIQTGRDGDARRELDLIAEPYGDAEILILWRRIHFAQNARQADAADTMARRMAELCAREGEALFEHRVIGHFDLARYHERKGRPAEAFHHWTAGHRLAGRLQPFSREAYEEFFAASREAFSAARFRDGPAASNRNAAPVFVVGLPRSGTTLTEQILSAHAEVHGAGERSAVHVLVTRLAGPALRAATVRSLASLNQDRLDAAATSFLAELHGLAPEARLVVDKMPANALHLGFIASLLPGARVIFCRRDPRDIGLSIFQHRFFGWHPYAHDLGDLGWYIAAHERLMTHWRDVLPLPMIEVGLKDWVDDADATLDRLLGFLDLPPDPACARFHESDRLVRTASSKQVRQPINARGIGRWLRYREHLSPMLAELEAHLPARDPIP